MTLAAAIRGWRLASSIEEQRQFYGRGWSGAGADAWQLEQFNRLWREVSARVPRYRRLRDQGRLPAEFSDWQQFRDQMPTTERADVQAGVEDVVDPRRPPDLWRATGGSTGTPLRMPVWREELRHHSADFWLARSWFGVSPASRLFLLWGHAHLLGKGIRGRIAAERRRIEDRLLGYHRASAYDLDDASLRAAATTLIAFRPNYVVGYAVALDRFARANRDRAAAFRALGLSVVVATAESFPFADSATVVGDVLGCRVAMEYGAVETGPIAHQRPDGAFAVFWRHYRLEGVPSAEVDGADELLVTSLYPRCLPLVRYRIGDLARARGDLAHELAAVIGRCNESVHLAEGRVIHSEAFAHALRGIDGLTAYQVEQLDAGEVRLLYCGRMLSPQSEDELRRRLATIAPGLGAVTLERRDALPQTVAGKTPWLRSGGGTRA